MSRISDTIRDDHRQLDQIFRAIRSAKANEEKLRWRNAFAFELARHCISEEQVVLPMLQDKLKDGKDRQEQMRRDHNSIRVKLQKLRLIPLSDINFDQELQALWIDLSSHIEDSDTNDLAMLEERLTIAESESLSHSFCQAKMLATAGEHAQHEGVVHPADSLREFLSIPGASLADLDSTLGAGSTTTQTQTQKVQ